MSFKDICYDVPRPKSATGAKVSDPEVDDNTLRLLRHVNGAFRPGVLTALMGASGAGKTVSRLRWLGGWQCGIWSPDGTQRPSLVRCRAASFLPCPPAA